MASEIRVNKINSSSGVGTITLSPTGVDISGITTVSTLKVGTGLTASEDGDIFFTGVCTATTFAGSGANLTALPAAQLTGSLPAISGANLTGIAATDNVRTGILDVAGVGTFRGNIFQTSGRIVRGSTSTIQDGDAIAGGVNITGTDMDASVIMSVFGNDTDLNRISGCKSRNATIGSHTIVNDGDTLLSLKGFGSDGTDFEEAASIEFQVDGSPGDNDMPGKILFKTTADSAASPSERMRIDNSGQVGINVTPSDLLHLKFGTNLHMRFNDDVDSLPTISSQQDAGAYNGFGLKVDNLRIQTGTSPSERLKITNEGKIEHTSTANLFYTASIAGAVRLQFNHTGGGDVTISNPSSGSVTYNTSSDYRLKENEATINNALTTVKALKPYQFTWKHSSQIGQGFFAHEVLETTPNSKVVSGTKDAVDSDGNPIYQQVDYSKLVPLLTAALQEAVTKIEVLETRLNNAGIAT